MRVLCVAEKNKISKSVSATLSKNNFQTRDSNNKYIKNYTFKFNFPQWGECDVTMTAVSGHITKKETPKEFGWSGAPPKAIFDCPLETIFNDNDGSAKIGKNIEQLSRNSDILMIWTDCDREGEYIGWEILNSAKKGNPTFNLDNTYRAKFSHLEPSHIYRAACNPIKLDKLAIDAVDTRMEIDFRLGCCFTRLLTKGLQNVIKLDDSNNNNNNKNKNQKKDKGKQSKLISYGTCQFPTLGFVVDRFLRIKNFKSENFWFIELNLRKSRKKFSFTWERGRLFDRLLVVSIYQNCINESAGDVIVKNITTKPTKKYAPLPLTTVELQKDCSKLFKLSAKDTLQIAEELYTKGLISYPRTETDSFPRSMDFKHFISLQKDSNDWGEYATSLLNDSNNKFRIPRRGKNDDEAHPPIHPVGYNSNLSSREKIVYEYIVRRFLASCSLDAVGSLTNITVQWSTEIFKTSGLVVLERNYLDIFKWDNWDSSKKALPELSIGERVSIADAKVSSGKTVPPKPLTETELISLMDVNGIGTDATIAEHIDKIIQRNYIMKIKEGTRKSAPEILQPTILGYSLSLGFSQIGLNNISLTKPFMRGDMENDLKEICNGTKGKNQVLNETLKVYKEAFEITERNLPVLVNAYKSSLNYTYNSS